MWLWFLRKKAEISRSNTLDTGSKIVLCGTFELPGMLEELDPDLMLELDKEVQS